MVPPPPTIALTRVSRSGAADWLTVVCEAYAGQQCAGTLTFTSHVLKHGATVVGVTARKPAKEPKRELQRVTVVVASASYAVQAGRSTTIRVGLNATGRRLLTQFYTRPTTISVRDNASALRTITFSYPLVTQPPDSSWVTWKS